MALPNKKFTNLPEVGAGDYRPFNISKIVNNGIIRRLPELIMGKMSPIVSILRHFDRLATGLLMLVFACPVFCNSAITVNRDLEIVGWIERARLMQPDVHLKAKLDTGADTSSLDVEIVKKFRKDNRRWVRFRLIDRETGEEHIIVRERIRTVSIVMHDGERQSRPVVRMKICIAGRIVNTEVSLIDRSEFKYPLLLGRKALESFALVDPGNTYLSTPDCRDADPDGSSDS